jgi:hypothetical protein
LSLLRKRGKRGLFEDDGEGEPREAKGIGGEGVVTADVVRAGGGDGAEGVTDYVSAGITDDVTAYVTEKITRDVTLNVTGNVTGNVTQSEEQMQLADPAYVREFVRRYIRGLLARESERAGLPRALRQRFCDSHQRRTWYYRTDVLERFEALQRQTGISASALATAALDVFCHLLSAQAWLLEEHSSPSRRQKKQEENRHGLPARTQPPV